MKIFPYHFGWNILFMNSKNPSCYFINYVDKNKGMMHLISLQTWASYISAYSKQKVCGFYSNHSYFFWGFFGFPSLGA